MDSIYPGTSGTESNQRAFDVLKRQKHCLVVLRASFRLARVRLIDPCLYSAEIERRPGDNRTHRIAESSWITDTIEAGSGVSNAPAETQAGEVIGLGCANQRALDCELTLRCRHIGTAPHNR